MKMFTLASLLPAVSAEPFSILRSQDGSEISLEKAPGKIVSPAKFTVPTGCDHATARPIKHDDGTYALQLDLGTCSGDEMSKVAVAYSTATVKAPPTPAPTTTTTTTTTPPPTPPPGLTLTTLSDFIDRNPQNPEGKDVTFKSVPAIGFTRCGSGGSIYSKEYFTGTKTISFDFAGAEGGFMGFDSGSGNTYGPHDWPIATQSYKPNMLAVLDSDSNWKSYSVQYRCPYDRCRVMLEDWSGSGGSCGNVYFANFRIF